MQYGPDIANPQIWGHIKFVKFVDVAGPNFFAILKLLQIRKNIS
jgi:hypothetical protein